MTPRTLTVPDLARFGTARAGAVIIVSLVVLGVIAGVIWNVVQGPRWTATTNVLIRLSSVDTLLLTGNVDSSNSTDQMDDAFLATSQDILGEVIRQLHPVGGLPQLQKDVNATPQGSSHVIVISATEPDPVTAQRISDTVANTFVAAVHTRLTTLAASQPPTRVPTALGIVGLAAGALVVLALSLLGLRVDRPRDTQRLLEVPAVPYDRSDGSAAAARLVQAVLRAHPVGTLLICPVDPEAELAAVRFAGWVREHGQGEQDSPREVRLVPEPASAVVGARPPAQDTAGLLLVVPRGTSRHVLADAAALLNTWRRVDAVAVTT
jgi:capsular polysaccharide biosynthesis protein